MYRYLALFLTAMIINGEVVAGEGPDGRGSYLSASTMTCGTVSDWRRANDLSLLNWYIAGWATGINFATPSTYNILGSTDVASAREYVLKHCADNPLSNTAKALNMLYIELYPKRQQRAP